MHSFTAIRRAVQVGLLAGAMGSTGLAQTYVETPDAGQTTGTASATGQPGDPLSTITGSLEPVGSASTDVDFFFINVLDPSNFSASTDNAGTDANLDTVLFLLGLDGTPILLNDDAAGGLTTASTIPAGSLSLVPQVLILGISLSGIEPVTAASQALFESGALSTDLRGPNPVLTDVLGGFSDAGLSNPGGNYQIDLAGVEAVPEASSVAGIATVLLAGTATLAFRRRSGRTA